MARSVLVVGQSAQLTGWARVVRAVADSLAETFEVHVASLDATASATTMSGTSIHPNPAGDPYARRATHDAIGRVHPDVVIFVHDYWVLPLLLHNARSADHTFTAIGYVPVDTPHLMPGAAEHLAGFDVLVAYTQFGRRALAQGLAEAGLDRLSTSVRAIGHGVDTTFRDAGAARTVADRRRARRCTFPTSPELWDDGVIVLNANRNQGRKRLDLTIRVFAEAVRGGHEGVRLCLHSARRPVNGVDLVSLAEQAGVADRLVLTGTSTRDHPSFSDHQLVDLYRSCQIGINTAAGEGWGLVSFEHAATGAVQLVPDHTAGAELWNRSGSVLLDTAPSDGTRFVLGPDAEIDVPAAGAALRCLLDDPARTSRLGAAGAEIVRHPRFTWSEVGRHWTALVNECVA